MKYIINASGVVFFHQGKTVKFEKGSFQYTQALKIFDLPNDQQSDALDKIIARNSGNYSESGFEVTPESVRFEDEEIPQPLANKIRNILKEGLPLTLFKNFWQNLKQNPSANSVRELYGFLEYKELPITEDGCFIAYKGLQKNGWSILGNTTTKVIQGRTDKSGHIYNGIGETIEVRRWDVDDNRNNYCSYGLHVGSLDYAQDYSRGQIVVVKVNPKDVVSVPDDSNCQKCRVAKYVILDAFESEITASVTDQDGEAIESEDFREYSEFEQRVERYIEKKYQEGNEFVYIRSIQNSFSPYYPSKTRVLDAITNLGYVWVNDETGEKVIF